MKRLKRISVYVVTVFSLSLLLFSLYVKRESTAILNDVRDDRWVAAAVPAVDIPEEKHQSLSGPSPLRTEDTHSQETLPQQHEEPSFLVGLRGNGSLPAPQGEAAAAKLSDNQPLHHNNSISHQKESHRNEEVSARISSSPVHVSDQRQITMNSRKVQNSQKSNIRTSSLPLNLLNKISQSDPHIISIPPQNMPKYTTLSREDADNVEKFVFFVGYGRSGSSVIGSILDAHPNVIIAHEFFLFRNWETFPRNRIKKYLLFNALYRSSYNSRAYGWRNPYMSQKGYTLGIEGLKQGEYDHLRVIGDKAAADAADIFHRTPDIFTKYYYELLHTVKVPIHAIHVIRNPYDMIATVTLYRASDIPEVKATASPLHKFSNETKLLHAFHDIFDRAAAVVEMKGLLNLTILDIHSEDLIRDPKYTIQRLCGFLELECSEDYIHKCSKKAFMSVSRTRDLISWSPELRTMIEQEKEKYPFFKGYSFEQDYWME